MLLIRNNNEICNGNEPNKNTEEKSDALFRFRWVFHVILGAFVFGLWLMSVVLVPKIVKVLDKIIRLHSGIWCFTKADLLDFDFFNLNYANYVRAQTNRKSIVEHEGINKMWRWLKNGISCTKTNVFVSSVL